MDLRQMRREAMNYYNCSPQRVKNLVYQFFESMDTNGDGGVDFYEVQSFLRGRTFLSRFLSGSAFRELDRDGNGTLDFYEFITLFYIVFMCFSCDECRAPLRRQRHLTCRTCFTSANHNGNTYDICGSCYARGYFRHRHANLVDYYTLILDGGSGSGSRNNDNNHAYARRASNNRAAYAGRSTNYRSVNNTQLSSRSGNSRAVFGQLLQAVEAANSVSTIASFATGAASCTIM